MHVLCGVCRHRAPRGVPELRWQHGGPANQTAGAIGQYPASAERIRKPVDLVQHQERVAMRQA